MNLSLIGRKNDSAGCGQKEKENQQVKITPTGRVWVKPNEIVKTEEFQKQLEAVKQLRQVKRKSITA